VQQALDLSRAPHDEGDDLSALLAQGVSSDETP